MPLERLFFDTTIVCNIRWLASDPTFEDGFYDYKSHKFVKMHHELRADCVALRLLLDKDDEFGLQFVTSRSALQEISETQNPEKRKELQGLYFILERHFRIHQIDYLDESELPHLAENEGLYAQPLRDGCLDFLPQKSDRLLIIDSLQMRCHIFLTTDRKTIWDYRHDLGRLGINVQRPSEYLSNLLPPLSPGNIGLLPYGNLDDVLGK